MRFDNCQINGNINKNIIDIRHIFFAALLTKNKFKNNFFM